MPNTLGTINGTLIAQRALRTLLVRFPILALITTDFSPEGVKFNQTVVSHVVSATTAGDYDVNNGYVSTARTQVDVPVTINKHKHHTYEVNDQERTSTDINLIDRFAETAAHALGKVLVDDLMALVTVANFANATTAATASAMVRGKVIDVGQVLNERFVPELDRFMMLNSAYYAALCKDAEISHADSNPASNTIGSGRLPNVHGFAISEYASLPGNDGPTNTLKGFAGNKECLILTTRLPKEPDVKPVPGLITTVTEPNTKLSIQLRQWYDMQKGKEFRTMTLMYGVAKGVTENLQRISIAG